MKEKKLCSSLACFNMVTSEQWSICEECRVKLTGISPIDHAMCRCTIPEPMTPEQIKECEEKKAANIKRWNDFAAQCKKEIE